ncbi:hypothetical protein NEFER03_1576 [Nematocida sp. LUAm3]|nr:hypothetical protein NEFER03_1576 [Nematocida sp. LUAm3]KAI5174652.1 hypothetical protein NEFER02_0762 [Nematocida sp. LUAm2]KAI5177787.1 hypothetical protein NEFER01_0989 [Nematocida sp. LUAm1]
MDALNEIFGKKQEKQKKRKESSFSVREIPKNSSDAYTRDGYKIYTSEELKLGRGKETQDCPFNCNCCF